MIKRISILLFAVAVLAAGYYSFQKVNFWERSVMIFKIDNSTQTFSGREDRRGEGFREGLQRPGRLNSPDSLRGRLERRGQRPVTDRQNRPDSLRTERNQNNSALSDRRSFRGNVRGEGRDGGREFRGGKKVNLKTVMYYLAVFGFFTVIIIYIEKAYFLIFKKKNV